MMEARLLIGLAAAVGAAACYNAAIALQSLDARRVPASHALRLSLIGQLLRRPRWVLATLLGLAGLPLEILALTQIPLTLVVPAMALGLLVLLVVGGRLLGESVGRREVMAAAGIVVGVVALTLAAPAHTSVHAGTPTLMFGLGVVALGVIAPYLLPRRRRSARFPLIVSAGAGYAWAALTSKLIADELVAGATLAAAAWLAGTATLAALGLLSEMTALQLHPATRVASGVFVVETAAPVLLAPLLGGESWGSPLHALAIVASFLVVTVSGAVLGSSPAVGEVVAGEAGGRRRGAGGPVPSAPPG